MKGRDGMRKEGKNGKGDYPKLTRKEIARPAELENVTS